MANLTDHIQNYYRENSVEIMMGTAITGTLATAYLSARAGYIARTTLEAAEVTRGPSTTRMERFKERIKPTWKLYIPPAVAVSVTVFAIYKGADISKAQTAAATTLLAASERVFAEYKTRVTEELGAKKELAIRDRITQENVSNNPPSNTIIIGTGKVMCMEEHTGRYFECNADQLQRAANTVNAQMNRGFYATLDDFYYEVKLPSTSTSNRVGWENDKLLELRITSAIAPDGNPCLCFSYNYLKTL